MLFNQFKLSEPILKALESQGYETPTPIQSQAIPIVLSGQDLLGCAQTGTGKTAAFLLPIIELLYQQKLAGTAKPKDIKTLIVTPTRELAIQIGESMHDYGKNTGLKHAVIFGGVPQGAQVNQLRANVDVLIATPGRLLDLINQGFIALDKLSIFVLDEADRMLDMGFIHDVKKIIKLLPQRKQSLFFSATMPEPIQKLADTILHNPAKVEVTPVSSTAEKISQALYYVDQANKYDLLTYVLEDKSITSALVFTRTKHGADKVVKMLAKYQIGAEAIHGNKSQNARQKALANFKSGTTRVLVATDIAARGIDIDELAFVVNFEVPNIPETYVHRIGRTGRAGSSGKAISFCDVDEKPFINDIQKLISQTIPVVNNHPYPALETVADGKFKSKPRQPREQREPREPRQSRDPRQGTVPKAKDNRTSDRPANSQPKSTSSFGDAARPNGPSKNSKKRFDKNKKATIGSNPNGPVNTNSDKPQERTSANPNQINKPKQFDKGAPKPFERNAEKNAPQKRETSNSTDAPKSNNKWSWTKTLNIR